MKPYRITKIVYAKNFKDATKRESEGEIVEVQLNEPVERPTEKYGFTN